MASKQCPNCHAAALSDRCSYEREIKKEYIGWVKCPVCGYCEYEKPKKSIEFQSIAVKIDEK